MEVIQVQEDSVEDELEPARTVSEEIISRFQDEIEGINKKNATLKTELATKVEIEKQLLAEYATLLESDLTELKTSLVWKEMWFSPELLLKVASASRWWVGRAGR